MKKGKVFIGVFITFLLLITAYVTYSRYTKAINKDGTILTADTTYCKNEGISSLRECLIRNDSHQELNDAINTISNRSNSVSFTKVEPVTSYVPSTNYYNYEDKTSVDSIAHTTGSRFLYVVENKLIDSFNVDDNEVHNIVFDQSSGYYELSNTELGDISDVVTTQEDMNNGVYKYTCLNLTNNKCDEMYLFTEEPYIISDAYRFKQGYLYKFSINDTSSSLPGLYKGEDDYTTYSGNSAVDNFTYYYRGDVRNNWVKFGDFLWRVVRINGDGSIRLIYSGKTTDQDHTGTNAVISFPSDDVNISNTLNSNNTIFDDTEDNNQYRFLFNDNNIYTDSLYGTSYENGRYGSTYAGYMYNPNRTIMTSPSHELNSSDKLNTFPNYSEINSTVEYYYFKNFDINTDCNVGTNGENDGVCTLKCDKKGTDCIKALWSDLMSDSSNYDVNSNVNRNNQYKYTSDFKYTCWSMSNPVEVDNGDNTTSVYVSCPIVSEILGVVDNQPTQARIRYHGLFSASKSDSDSNIKDSQVKRLVDYWYSNNLLNNNDSDGNKLEKYLSDEIFCNDRSTSTNGYMFTKTDLTQTYNSYIRNYTNYTPSFKCSNGDSFTMKNGSVSTVNPSGTGNGKLTYPIGLITVDEVVFAGAKNGFINKNFYLNVNQPFWTMSQSSYLSSTGMSNLWIVNQNGVVSAFRGSLYNSIRPVINLKSDVLYTNGSGTETDPYIISISE